MTISTIAIDGPAASGKSTVGELLARRLGYLYFDTGVMYRAVTWAALDRGMSLNSSFAEARWTLQEAHPFQTPWLDDNGNGIPNEVEDGQEAAQRGFAYAGTFSNPQWPPYIAQAVVQLEEGVIKAQIQAQEGKIVSSTWALIYRPSYEPPPPGQDMVRDEDGPNYWSITAADGLSVSVGGMWQFTTAPAATGDFWVYLPLVVRDD